MVYEEIDLGVLGNLGLVDKTSKGTTWDTWQYVEAFDYDNKTGLLGNAWPTWMRSDNDNPNLGYADPASGPIDRWGNDEWDEWVIDTTFYVIHTGLYIRESGPTGPVDKGVWDVQELK